MVPVSSSPTIAANSTTRPLASWPVLICSFVNNRHRYKRANSKVGVDDEDDRKFPQDVGPSVTSALHCGASSTCKTQGSPSLSVSIAQRDSTRMKLAYVHSSPYTTPGTSTASSRRACTFANPFWESAPTNLINPSKIPLGSSVSGSVDPAAFISNKELSSSTQ